MRALSALLLVLPASLLAQVERKTLSGSDFAIYDLAGKVTAEAGTGSDVVVEVTRGGADAAKLQIATGPLHGRQTLRVIFPDTRITYGAMPRHSNTTLDVDDDGVFGGNTHGHRVRISGTGGGLDASADLRILIPNGKRVRIALAAGSVSVKNVNGDIAVDAFGADVTTLGTKGALDLDTGSGDVNITSADGRLDLDSGSGDVTLKGIKGPSLKLDSGSGEVNADDVQVDRLDIDSGSGSVTIGALKAQRISLDSGSGRVDLAFTASVDAMDIDSGSGEVTLRLPSSFSASFDIDAGGGGVHTELPISVTHYESDRLVGKMGDGKGTVKIESGSGEVRLLKASN